MFIHILEFKWKIVFYLEQNKFNEKNSEILRVEFNRPNEQLNNALAHWY